MNEYKIRAFTTLTIRSISLPQLSFPVQPSASQPSSISGQIFEQIDVASCWVPGRCALHPLLVRDVSVTPPPTQQSQTQAQFRPTDFVVPGVIRKTFQSIITWYKSWYYKQQHNSHVYLALLPKIEVFLRSLPCFCLDVKRNTHQKSLKNTQPRFLLIQNTMHEIHKSSDRVIFFRKERL